MRKIAVLLPLLGLALLLDDAAAQKAPVTRIANVETIFVDRTSFRITYTSCGREVGGLYVPCANANKRRQTFLDSLERWLVKYGIKVAKHPAAADVVLKGTIRMYDDADQRRRDYKSATGSDQLPTDWRDEEWTIDARLENEFGDEIWRSGQRDYPRPSFGWSSIGKIKGKELAKEIEYSIRKGR